MSESRTGNDNKAENRDQPNIWEERKNKRNEHQTVLSNENVFYWELKKQKLIDDSTSNLE